MFDCSARLRSLRADRAMEPAYFVVARRRKACPLTPPQHGGGRDPSLIAPLVSLAPSMLPVYPVNNSDL
jgi:hypothetical protein